MRAVIEALQSLRGVALTTAATVVCELGSLSRFERLEWNREQQWMADTSLLMQMIDDWVDQDEDRHTRVTPVVAGNWNPQSVDGLYRKTVRQRTKFKVHDEKNECGIGDLVRITETRPISKEKRWRVLEIVEKAK